MPKFHGVHLATGQREYGTLCPFFSSLRFYSVSACCMCLHPHAIESRTERVGNILGKWRLGCFRNCHLKIFRGQWFLEVLGKTRGLGLCHQSKKRTQRSFLECLLKATSSSSVYSVHRFLLTGMYIVYDLCFSEIAF